MSSAPPQARSVCWSVSPEAENQTRELVTYMFENDTLLEHVELAGVICPVCGTSFSAPRLARVEDVGINVGRALYDSHAALETKDYGRFRFVDHFGLGRYSQQGEQRGGRRSFWLWGWILGFRTLFLIILLFYILGLEMKLGKKWFPLGPVLFALAIITFIVVALTTNVLDPVNTFIRRIIGSY